MELHLKFYRRNLTISIMEPIISKKAAKYMNNDFLITGIERIILVGEQEYTDPVTVFKSKHILNELIFHFSGKSTVLFNDTVLNIQPDTIRFLPHGDVTKYEVIREHNGACIDIVFKSDKPISEEAFTMDVHGNKKLASLFKKVFSIWVARNEGYYFESMSLIYKIFAEMQKENYLPDKQYKLIEPAVDYINEHFFESNISMDELAALCGISYSYFKQIFLRKFSISPKKYMISLKINSACELLKTEHYTVSQISHMCGFSDIYFFSRQFKEYMGITPTEFKAKYQSSK